MPNFDGGHYFLTTLAPIRVGAPEDGSSGSYVQRLQSVLESMPTALQSPATEKIGVESPFAKSLRTHLCRFVVIEDAVFNGRLGDDPVLAATPLRKAPSAPKHIDHLPCAYLMFAVDFDAVKTPGTKLPDELTKEQQDEIRDDYLESMWLQGSAELLKVYENCQAFDADTIKTPKDFSAYLQKCQLDSWMSFNDYYLDLPKLPPEKLWLLAVVALTALAVFFGVYKIFDAPWILAAIIAAVVTGFVSYRYILWRGQKPWPAARYGDLPSVLKGLYLQQKFSDFVVENQRGTAKQLHAAFGKFVKVHKPDDVLDPETTQKPGVIRS